MKKVLFAANTLTIVVIGLFYTGFHFIGRNNDLAMQLMNAAHFATPFVPFAYLAYLTTRTPNRDKTSPAH